MKKADEVKRDFELAGVAIADWATANGFEPRQVYAALNGRTRGRRGKAHEIALALGLKQRADEIPELLAQLLNARPKPEEKK